MARKKNTFAFTLQNSSLFLGVGLTLLVVIVVLMTFAVGAASDEYKFIVRGTVNTVDTSGSIAVNITHATGKAANDLTGVNQTFVTSAAKVYKEESSKLKRVKLANVKSGDEVLLKGAKKTDGKFMLTWIQVKDRSFTVVGKVNDRNLTDKQFKIEISYTTYKSSIYKDKSVWMTYDTDTKFTLDGNERGADDIPAGGQKAKITGKISGDVWKIEKFQDNYQKDK